MTTLRMPWPVAIGIAVATAFAGAADWPQWRGLNRDGKSAETNWLQQWPPVEVWRKTIGAGFSSPVVSEGRVYATGMEGGCTPQYTNGTNVVYCFDARTGSEIWTHRETWDNSMPIGPGSDYSYIFACPKGSPTVCGNELYTFNDPGLLYCFDKVTGNVLWSKRITAKSPMWYGWSCSPLIEGNLIILNAGGHGTAIDRNPPYDVVWPTVADTNWAGYSSPMPYTVGSRRCLAMFQCYNSLGLVGLDASTGEILWSTNTYYRQLSEDVVVLPSNRLYTTAFGGMMLQPGTNSMNVLWKGRQTSTSFDRNTCTAVAHGDQLYYLSGTTASLGGWLECFDIADGKSRWSKWFSYLFDSSGAAEAMMWGNFILADGWLLVAARHHLWVVRATPDKYDDGGRPPLRVASIVGNDWSVSSYSTPALVDGRIYYQLYDQLVCYQVSPKINRVPVAHNDAAIARRNTAVGISVLENDSDGDWGDVVTICAVAPPANGGSVQNNGTNVTYTPATGYTGEDNFAYTVTDGCGGYATGLVSVLVTDGDNRLAVGATATPTNGWLQSLTVQFGALAAGGQPGVASDTTEDATGTAEDALMGRTLLLFDNSTNVFWNATTNNAPDGKIWVQYAYAYGQRKRVEEYSIHAGISQWGTTTPVCYPVAWQLLGSNDRGATWTELDARTGQTFGYMQKRNFTVTSPGSYAMYRLKILGIAGSSASCYMYELELLEKMYGYMWSFGDGTTSALQNPLHTYTTNGDYEARVVVTDALGAKATNHVHISVSTPIAVGLPSKKMRIALDGYDRTETLTNFPALVVVRDGVGGSGFSYSQFASPYGWDLRFKDETETVALDYEIESWNPQGDSYVWVRIPAMTNHTAIWAYWGDCSLAFDPSVCMTNGAVWNDAYRAVWHLNLTNDATRNRNNVTNFGYCSEQPGIVGKGRSGSSQPVTVSDSASLSLTGSVTMEGWIRPYSSASQPNSLFAKDGDKAYRFWYGTTNVGVVLNDGSGAETNAWPFGFALCGWYHLAAVADLGPAKQVRLYVNGVQVGEAKTTAKNAIADTSGAMSLMYTPSGGGAYHDELRISAGTRSENWIWASWKNIASNGTFCGFGAIQPGSGQTDQYGIRNSWKVEHFGRTNAPCGGPFDDPDHDGMDNLLEYIAGTDPKDAHSVLTVNVQIAPPSGMVVSFDGMGTDRAGYEGRMRHYFLDNLTNLVGGTWSAIPAISNLWVPTDRPVTYTNATSGAVGFYRVRATLE